MFSQGRRPQPPSFSDVPRCLPCGSGAHAASRATSTRWDPGAGSSRLRRFTRPRYPTSRATFVGLRRRSVVAIDVHGSLDRAKDASLSRRPESLIVGCMRLLRACRRRSPPRRPEDTRCRRREGRKRRRPLPTCRTGQGLRSDATPRRAAPSRRPRCLPPSRTRKLAEDRSPGFRVGPLAHAAHTFSHGCGNVLFEGHCKRSCGQARSSFRERERLCHLLEKFAPGTDDPSTPTGSVDGVVYEADCLVRPTSAAAPRRLLQPRAREIGRAHV